MSQFTEILLKYSDGELNSEETLQIEKKILSHPELKEEYVLNRRIDEFMRIESMVNQIENDPYFPDIDSITKREVKDFMENEDDAEKGVAFYIKSSLRQNEQLEKEIKQAELELQTGNIYNSSREWVEQWEQQKKEWAEQDEYTRTIFDYVSQGMHMEMQTEIELLVTQRKRKLIYRISAVAAIFILALGLWGIINTNSPKELYVSYYEPYAVIDGQTRSTDRHLNYLTEEGIKLYKNGQFSEAGDMFKELIANDGDSHGKITLLYGITMMEEKNYTGAITAFEGIIEKNRDYTIESKWYLALCNIKINNLKLAKSLLLELSEIPGYYKNRANSLLEELK